MPDSIRLPLPGGRLLILAILLAHIFPLKADAFPRKKTSVSTNSLRPRSNWSSGFIRISPVFHPRFIRISGFDWSSRSLPCRVAGWLVDLIVSSVFIQ